VRVGIDLLNDLPAAPNSHLLEQSPGFAENVIRRRCCFGGYRFALNHLVVAEPERVAAEADIALTQLQQQIAANQLLPAPNFAAVPRNLAAQESAAVR